jgi:hypothetical protein
MKTILRLFILAAFLIASGVAGAQVSPKALLLDSVYSSNWLSNNWSLNTKNYRIKDGTGRTVQSLYKKYNSGTGHFDDFVRSLYGYPGPAADPVTITNQFWYSFGWTTYQYTHYLDRENVDTVFFKNWDNSLHKFTFGNKDTYLYDDSLFLLENINQSWDSTTNDWLNALKKTYAYTTDMKPLEQVVYSWESATPAWENTYKVSFVYDGSNMLVNRLEYVWNPNNGSWLSTLRYSYYNNPTSMPYLVVMERWDSTLSVWDSITQSTYLYNPFNWLMTVITKTYHPESSSWADSYLTYYTYNAQGDQRSMTGNVWNTVNHTWVTDAYTSNDSATGKLAESFTRFLDPFTFQVIAGTRNLNAYNALGDTTGEVHQEWQVSAGDWENRNQVVFTYDTHNLLVLELTQNWSAGTSSWNNSKKSDYYYSEFIGIDDPGSKERNCFYANPLVPGGTITCPGLRTGSAFTLRLTSLTGAEVFRTDFKGGESVTVPGSLSAGTYLLRIEEGYRIVCMDKVVIIH